MLDQEKVLSEFDAAWNGDGPRAVLVEASDLSRAEEYAPAATGRGGERDSAVDALERRDALVAALLQHVDSDHDCSDGDRAGCRDPPTPTSRRSR